MKLLAKTFEGLEEVLAQELRDIGAKNVIVLKRAVSFDGSKRILYRANLELRTALRILEPIKYFRARHEIPLYQQIQEIDWTKYIGLNDTFAIDSTVYSEYFKHSKYVALKTKDAIADQFRKKLGRRPSVNTFNPTLRINIHVSFDEFTVSLDSSGNSLHKRGYRTEGLDAPINEVLAAGMILLSGWKKDCNFIDPMCGSGTILTEAAMYAYNIPPHLHRTDFGFKNWKNYDSELWSDVLQQAKSKISNFDYKIMGSDKQFQAIHISARNFEAAGLEDKIDITRSKFERLVPPQEKGILIFNPPYDERLESDDIEALYTLIGDQLKNNFTGYDAWLISSNFDAIKKIGLRASRRINLFNGGLPCKFLKFEMYEGSKSKNNKVVDRKK